MYEDKALEIINRACKELKANKHTRVKSIHMTIGTASNYTKDCLELYIKKFAKGTAVEGAEIIVKDVIAKLRCPRCGKEYDRNPKEFKCPICFTEGLPCEIGTEMQVDKIDTE